MAVNKQTVYMRGKLKWAKVFDLVPNYNKDGYEWTFDLVLDANGLKQAKQYKALKPKDKDDDKVLSFKQKELRAAGTDREKANDPIRVTDAAGKAWDPDVKLGNGTVADVKFEVWDFGAGKYPGIYPKAIRVLDHVPYESDGFAPLDEDDEYYNADAANGYVPSKDEFLGHTAPEQADDLDDDIPL